MSIDVVLFDLDDTIYPASNGLMQSIDRRIGEYGNGRSTWTRQKRCGCAANIMPSLGRRCAACSITIMISKPKVTFNMFTISHSRRFSNQNEHLGEILAALPARKAIFTNSPHEHAPTSSPDARIAEHFNGSLTSASSILWGKPDSCSLPACAGMNWVWQDRTRC